MIELTDINKKYSTEYVDTYALKGVHLRIEEGEFVAICGASGGGKSTLLSVLGVLEKPTTGIYRVNGEEVTSYNDQKLSHFRRDEIGFIFQSFNLIESLSVLDNVCLPLVCKGNMSRQEMRALATKAIEKVGMESRSGHYPYQLSGGQQQRAAIARALVSNPKIILADEPTGNLDSENSNAVMELIKDQHKNGSTICLVTHDPTVSKWASRTIYMKDGMIAC